jgi:hypothetical protein
MWYLLLPLLAASISVPYARGFSSASGYISPTKTILGFTSHGSSTIHRQYSTFASSKVTMLHSSEDNKAEIAALEERLRQLRDQEISPQNNDKGIEYDLNAETADSIMFSERWKVTDENSLINHEENRMGANIALALVLVALTGIFSQVPIGEESLQKYQAVQGNPSRIDLGDLNPVQ